MNREAKSRHQETITKLSKLGGRKAKSLPTLAPALAEWSESDVRGVTQLAELYGHSTVEAFAVELLAKALRDARASLQKQQTRQRLMDAALASTYAPLVLERARSAKKAAWLEVSYERREVTAHELHPGSKARHVALDFRNRDEWYDLDGALTLASVTAKLLGYPRPDSKLLEGGKR